MRCTKLPDFSREVNDGAHRCSRRRVGWLGDIAVSHRSEEGRTCCDSAQHPELGAASVIDPDPATAVAPAPAAATSIASTQAKPKAAQQATLNAIREISILSIYADR
jgi:hypothetical protein